LINASRYPGFYEKAAVILRDIAGAHMCDNGNKRTAQAVVELLLQRNGIASGPNPAELRAVVDAIGKGQLRTVEEIARALRGY
jgi:prophage maintenance system killer protein